MAKTIKEEADTFLMWLGSCITEWAKVEEQLFKFCRDILGASTEHTAIIYYRTPTLDSRLNLIDELIATVIPLPKSGQHRHIDGKTWAGLYKNIRDNLPIRNQLAHCPAGPVMKDAETATARRYTLEYESYQHEHEAARGKTVRKNLTVLDLQSQFIVVDALHARLLAFRCDMLPAHISKLYPQNIGPLTGQD